MRSRAKIGLFIVSLWMSSTALAHAPGVTHTYVNGEPVITVRLVPDEAAVAKRVNALEPPAAEHVQPGPIDPAAEPVATEPVETADPSSTTAGEFSAPLAADPAMESAAAPIAPSPRYPNARPAMKPNTETGVGGALDLAPPAATETPEPRPMRLNSVERPRRVVERAAKPQPREERRRVKRAQSEAPPASVAPASANPLDEAFSPSGAGPEPIAAMELPPVKTEERLADGN